MNSSEAGVLLVWHSNFYPFVCTAGLVLVGALTPAVHGSSHGQTSFSGYLPSRVDSPHHSSPDVHHPSLEDEMGQVSHRRKIKRRQVLP